MNTTTIILIGLIVFNFFLILFIILVSCIYFKYKKLEKKVLVNLKELNDVLKPKKEDVKEEPEKCQEKEEWEQENSEISHEEDAEKKDVKN